MTTCVLIVGTGALATLFASRLSATGIEVTILGTWQEGLEALRNGGAYLEGEARQPVRVTDNPADCRGTKLALVLVKSWQTERAAHQLTDCLEDGGLVVTFQNGLGNDDILAGILGRRRVSRGVTTVGATLLAPSIVRVNGWGAITLEEHPQIAPLAEMLRVAEFRVSVIEDILPVAWGKLVVNAAINPLTGLLRVKNGDLLANPSAHEIMIALAREAALVAEAIGVALPFSNPEIAVEEVLKDTRGNISSMLKDILRGAPTEVDFINGVIINKGEQAKILTPVNYIIWRLVKALIYEGKI